MTYRDSYESEDYPRMTPAVQWLIAINVAVAFLQIVVFAKDGVPGLQQTLGFRSDRDILGSWWTVVTYMFAHGGVLHVAMNMYTLWLFGPRLEHEWGTKPFLRYYIWCGLGGLVAHALLVHDSGLIGASAAVFGVMLAYAVRWPDQEIMLFGVVPLKVKWLVSMLLTLNLISGIVSLSDGSEIAYFAHLGGVAFGWLYLRTSPMQSIERLRQRISSAPDVPDDETPRAIPRSLPRGRERQRDGEMDEIVAQSKAVSAQRPAVAAPRAENTRERQVETLNSLLDKISQGGIASLTAEERRVLEEVSRGMKTGPRA